MKAYWRLALVGVAAYLLLLLVTLPAKRVGRLLEHNVPGLSLQFVSGTLYSGEAQRVVIGGLAMGPASWTLRPLPLLLARLEYRLRLAGPAIQGKGVVGMGLGGHLYLHGLRAKLEPDPLITHFSPVPVETSGTMTVRIDTLELGDGFPRRLTGRLNWVDGRLIEPVKLALGHVEATVQGKAGALVGHVSGSGETALAGDFSLSPKGAYTLRLLLTPGPSVSPEVVDGLKSFAQSAPGGAYLIRDSGRI